MGYYTYYSMEAQHINDREQYNSIIDEMKKHELFSYEDNAGVFDSGTYHAESNTAFFEAYDDCKWYDHAKDMREFSKLFPNVTFRLHGEGEERDDMWYEYFHNGDYEDCYVHITYDKPVVIHWEE
jgi:hypothetical protein